MCPCPSISLLILIWNDFSFSDWLSFRLAADYWKAIWCCLKRLPKAINVTTLALSIYRTVWCCATCRFFLTDGWRHWPVFRLFVGLLNLWFEWNCAFDLSPLWLRHLKSMLVCPYRLCRCYIYQSQAHHDWSCFCFIFDISPAYVSPLLFFFFLRLTSFGCCNACARQLNFLLYPVWCKRCFPVLRRNVVSPFEGHTWAKKSALNNGVSVGLFIGFRLRSWSAMSVASCSSKDFKKPIAANIPALLSTRAANA